jgi:sugar-specific transcriptional regulator TrmB
MAFQHYVELLVRLGLTFTEAKVFLALCTIGTSTAKMLSENAGVAREVIYQVMPTLQKKNIIETQLTTPQSYTAIPTEYAFAILLEQKTEENKKTKQEITQALKALKTIPKPNSNDYHQITIIPPGKAVLSKMATEMRNVQKNVDMIVTWQKFLKWNRLHRKNEINQAKQRNVRFQILVEKESVQSEEPPLRPAVFGSKYFENIHIRFAANATLTNMVIFDDEKVFLDIAQNQRSLEMSCMYSNNPCLTPLATAYFQTNWEKAIPLQSIRTALQNNKNS